jgi:hypothetical protein
MNEISPASPPTGPMPIRSAPCVMAQRCWRACRCVVGVAAVCSCGMGDHISSMATPVIVWQPTMGGTIANISRGEPVDAFVGRWVLTPLEPAALTLSLEATMRLERERQALDRLWQQRLERAGGASLSFGRARAPLGRPTACPRLVRQAHGPTASGVRALCAGATSAAVTHRAGGHRAVGALHSRSVACAHDDDGGA